MNGHRRPAIERGAEGAPLTAGEILITGIRLTPLFLTFKEPYHWAGRVDYGSPVVLIEVETDAGITGVGESVSSLAAEMTTAALRSVESLFLGQPIHDVGRLVHEARYLGTFNHMPWFSGFVLAGFEMALWDAIGKAAGQPVYRLLGGAVRDEVDYFGFVQGDTTEDLVEDALDLAAAEYGVIYLKVGRGDEVDVRNTAAVREAIGRRRLRVDPNCAWSVPDAIRMIHALEPYGLDWVEQPTTLLSITAMRQVREAVHVPIAADQAVLTANDVYDFVRQQACDAICLSAHETGGLLAFGRAAAVAAVAGVPICLHGQSVSGITDAAQHHLGLSTPNLTDGNQIMHQLLVEDLVTTPDLTPSEGKIGLLDGPGLGVELDRDAVERAAERYRKGALS